MAGPAAKLRLLTTEGRVIDAILYCHQETVTIAGTTYYLLKLDTPADSPGTTLSASTASVTRVIWGRFVYPLTGVRAILPSTIYATYRAYTTGGTVYAEIDIHIMRATGGVRTTIATGVSRSPRLGSSWATLTGASYSFPGYTVEDQTDYLLILYIANVTARRAGAYAYLRIDDQTLPLEDQTRSQEWAFAGVEAGAETIVGADFPMEYLPAPPRATQLTSKVTGAVVLRRSQDYPLTLVKEGKANVLKSKFRP